MLQRYGTCALRTTLRSCPSLQDMFRQTTCCKLYSRHHRGCLLNLSINKMQLYNTSLGKEMCTYTRERRLKVGSVSWNLQIIAMYRILYLDIDNFELIVFYGNPIRLCTIMYITNAKLCKLLSLYNIVVYSMTTVHRLTEIPKLMVNSYSLLLNLII